MKWEFTRLESKTPIQPAIKGFTQEETKKFNELMDDIAAIAKIEFPFRPEPKTKWGCIKRNIADYLGNLLDAICGRV